MNVKQEIKKILIGLAEYYGINLTPAQLEMYSEDLLELSLEQITLAVKTIRKDPAQKFFPRPSLIIEAALGSNKDAAIEATNRIVQAMSMFGWTNPESAKKFIGELGWRVVEREGGWKSMCEKTTYDDLPILKAQWRELAISTNNRHRSGQDNIAPSIGNNNKYLTDIIQDTFKKITAGGNNA